MSELQGFGRVGGRALSDRLDVTTTYAAGIGNSRATDHGLADPSHSADSARNGMGRHGNTPPVVALVVAPRKRTRPSDAVTLPTRERLERMADLCGRTTAQGSLYAVRAIEAGR